MIVNLDTIMTDLYLLHSIEHKYHIHKLKVIAVKVSNKLFENKSWIKKEF